MKTQYANHLYRISVHPKNVPVKHLFLTLLRIRDEMVMK